MKAVTVDPELVAREGASLKFVYSPLHGTGQYIVKRLFNRLVSLTILSLKNKLSLTVIFDALTLAIEYAKREGADAVVATDPDADRMGAAVKLADATIDEYEATKSHEFLFGFEESFGYLVKPFAHDKDAIQALVLFAEVAAYYKSQGKTFAMVLDFPGIHGNDEMAAIISEFRNNQPDAIGSVSVARVQDFLSSLETDNAGATLTLKQPKANVLKYWLADAQLRTDIPEFRAGDTVKVYAKIVEGSRERIQLFEGVVIKRKGAGIQSTYTVRKISSGVGVELLGRLVADAGGAYRIAHTLIAKFGKKRVQLAIMVAAFIIGIALFFEVGMVLLIPIVFAIALEASVPLLYLGIPMAAALSVTHGFLPPHPAPTAIAGALGANPGTVLVYGLIVAIPAAIIAGPIFTKLAQKFAPDAFVVKKQLTAFGQQKTFQINETPSFGISVLTSLFPVLLMELRPFTQLSTMMVNLLKTRRELTLSLL
ncbi:hypothetical protein Pfo_031339 [Paulownia fortunei]|nr:hypothetical protein Pfo_031339 [Paulownia fortunei]